MPQESTHTRTRTGTNPEPSPPGMFVVLEGIEGSGKTTQARLLGGWLAARDVAHVVVREPGGTEVGEEIRRLLLESETLPDRTELMLMLAARAAVVAQVIRPALAAGRVVVADRYALSTLAYQGHGRGLELEDVRRANALATGGLEPDVTLWLDVSPEVGRARRREAGLREDRIERAGGDFHERVARAYGLLAESERNVERVAAADDAAAVHERVLERLRSRFPETFSAAPG